MNYIPVPYRRPVNIALLVVAAVVIYFLGRRWGLWDQKKMSGSFVEFKPGAPPPRSGFNAANEVNKIADLLSYVGDWSGQDEQAFDAILAYSDNETIAVHNKWRETYKGGKFWDGIKPTLREQVNAESIWFYRSSAIAKKNRVIQKLDRLNL